MNVADTNSLKHYRSLIDLQGFDALTEEGRADYNRLITQELEEKKTEDEAKLRASLAASEWDHNHKMDPETEDLIFGKKLQNGMRVLVEDTFHFDKPSNLDRKESYPGEHDRLRRNLDITARWCTVTELDITRRFEEGTFGYGSRGREIAPLVKFIGVYDDGTKATRSYDAGYGWFVKLDSIETEQQLIEEATDALTGVLVDIFAGIRDALDEQIAEAVEPLEDWEEVTVESLRQDDAEVIKPLFGWEQELLHAATFEHTDVDEDGICHDCEREAEKRQVASDEALSELRNRLSGVPVGATQADYVSQNDIENITAEDIEQADSNLR